jgi:hypothetical protein
MREIRMFVGYSDDFAEFIGRMISAADCKSEGTCT